MSEILRKLRRRVVRRIPLRTRRMLRARLHLGPVPLPPRDLRMGGKHFQDDAEFVDKAKADVRKLVAQGLTKRSRVLDWGCGAGRLAIGIIGTWGTIGHYSGVDVQAPLIAWASANISPGRPRFEFTHVDIANARYNPAGEPVRTIPGADGSVDAFHAYSVLSHMTTEDVKGYLAEIRRLLAPRGFAWVTAFVEDDVPDEVENPAGYGPLRWSGRLHCVRFNRAAFDAWIAEAGLRIVDFSYGTETDGQSAYVLRR